MNLKPTTGRSGTGINGAGNKSAGLCPIQPSAVHTRLTCLGLTGLLLGLFLFPGTLFGQRPHTNAPPEGNRYLVVVETSRAMQERGNGVLTSLQQLLGSGFQGQLRDGDSIGVWVFNEQLSVGQMPLQVWSKNGAKGVTARVLRFLQEQKCENAGKFDCVEPTLKRVVEHSRFLTVILVSSGEKIHGTPFDAEINKCYKSWRAQQQQAHMPFITALRAEKGVFVERTVVPVPWKVQLPGRPAELQLAQAAPAKAPVVPKPKPAVPVQPPPPLIVTGKKTQPALLAATNTVVATSTPSAASEAPHAVALPAKPEMLGYVLPPEDEDGKRAIATKLASQLVNNSENPKVGVAPATAATREPMTAKSAPLPMAPPVPSAAAVTSASLVQQTAASTSSQAEKPAEPKVEPAPAAPEKLEEAQVSASTPAAAATAVIAAPLRQDWLGKYLWMALIAVAGVGFGMFLMRRTHSRPVQHGSLITRSYEHK